MPLSKEHNSLLQNRNRSSDRVPPPAMVEPRVSESPQGNLNPFLATEEWRGTGKPKKISSSIYSPSAKKRENTKMKSNKSNSGSKYLKPGALAQLRDARVNNRASSYTATGRKRVLVMDYSKINNSNNMNNNTREGRSSIVMTASDNKFNVASHQNKMFFFSNLSTPKTPTRQDKAQGSEIESHLESLPFDILLRILCLLHHDQLKTVFHVSQRLRKVALVARQCYFNYTTPDRSRQEMLRLTTPRPDEHWPFLNGLGVMQCPLTPKAPRHDQRPPTHLSMAEMRQISASLFHCSSSRFYRTKPPGLPRPGSRYLTSHRILFNEDELCQAVSQNALC